jgi:8-oxo-dGTP diphosphatase
MDLISKNHYIPQVAIDCVIFGFENNQLKVLVSKLNYNGDFFALHSGFIRQEEDLDDAAKRVLKDRTGMKNIYLQQFHVFGKASHNRKQFLDDLINANYSTVEANKKSLLPLYQWFTMRFISIGYYALVDLKKVSPKLTKFDAFIKWYPIYDLPKLVMHYDEVLETGLRALRKDIDQKFNAFNLLPEKFTMKEVQQIYEAVFDRKYTRSNFQKKILQMNVLNRLEKKYTGAKNKAPYLYELRNQES